MIVTFTGPSGSGKTSLLFKLMKRWPDKIHPIISSTSRSPRSREIERINYYFVDRSAFDSEDMVEKVTFGEPLWPYQGRTQQSLRQPQNLHCNRGCQRFPLAEGALRSHTLLPEDISRTFPLQAQ